MEQIQGLHILYYNAHTLLPKMDELRAVKEASKPDSLLCIVETWLDEDVVDSELVLANFPLFRMDHNRHGGGVGLCKIILHAMCCCMMGHFLFWSFPLFLYQLSLFQRSYVYCSPSSPVSIFDDLFSTLFLLNSYF